MLSVKCTNCGSTVRFDEGHIATFCTYCGAHLPDMTNYVKHAADLELQKKEHNMHMETMDKQIKIQNIVHKADKTADILNIIKAIIVVPIVFMFFLILYKMITS